MTNITKDSQISLRLPLEMKEQMQNYAQLTGRNKSHVVMEAVAEYLAWRTPQIEDLQKAIQAADAGEFASEVQANAVFARWAKGSSRAATKPTAKPPARRRA